MDKLKSCPFCGEDRASVCDGPAGVHCNGCGLYVEWPDGLQENVTAWNSRTPPWVPVGERLPELGSSPVLTYSKDTGIAVGSERAGC